MGIGHAPFPPPPPSASWAENTLITDSTRENGDLQSMHSLIFGILQGMAKRCRLFGLTNNVKEQYMSDRLEARDRMLLCMAVQG